MDELDPLDQKKLDEITSKEPLAWTESEKAFIRARQDNLTPTEKVLYKDVLNGTPEPVPAPANPAKSRKYRDMQSEAREKGLPYIGVSREDLERALDTTNGPK